MRDNFEEIYDAAMDARREIKAALAANPRMTGTTGVDFCTLQIGNYVQFVAHVLRGGQFIVNESAAPWGTRRDCTVAEIVACARRATALIEGDTVEAEIAALEAQITRLRGGGR